MSNDIPTLHSPVSYEVNSNESIIHKGAPKLVINDWITLKNIELKIKKGEFVAIIGDTGSGKSSILSTIIGDMLYLNKQTTNAFTKATSNISSDYECPMNIEDLGTARSKI